MKKAYLVLSNGRVFEGTRIGAEKNSIGELVFTTGVVGYLETLTDPSYAGQIVIQTFPLIGNYGVINEDLEGECAVAGYIIRECCDTPSNFRCEYELDAFLKEKGICGISGIDTRELTTILREEGVMNAAILDSLPDDNSSIINYSVNDVINAVGCKKTTQYPAKDKEKYSVVMMDFGATKSVINNLCELGCRVITVPRNTPSDEILSLSPNGIVISQGPGDPNSYTECIAQISKLIGKLPMLGVGLGHQLIALAMGGKTMKLKCGHRGSNQPVKDIETNRTYITSQNHGYVVSLDSLSDICKTTFTNANDGSCEGLEYPGKKCYTVQFSPESSGGPNSTEFIFNRFINMMEGSDHA